MSTYHLHNWSVCGSTNPYQPPNAEKRLAGRRADEDRSVITGPIVKIEGRKITTYSGSVYLLEEIDPDYLRWMEDNGYHYDPENPIKDKSGN